MVNGIFLQISKEQVDSYRFETEWRIPSCQMTAVCTTQNRPSRLIHKMMLKGTKGHSYFSIVLDPDLDPLSPESKSNQYPVV